MYKVIKLFADLHDNDHVYQPGDVFPREGITVTAERLAELAGSKNKQGVPLIEKVETEEELTGMNAPEEPDTAESAEEPKKKTAAKRTRKKATAE